MAKIGKAAKSSAKSDKPVLMTSAYHDEGRLERLNKHYERDYGFTKGLPPRSPVNSEWYYNQIAENRPFMDEDPPYLPKEQALVIGAVHGFGHKKHQMEGALRHSGDPKAHRIGKRK